MSFQKLIILGRLTRDPELRTASTGISIASLSVAVDGYQKREDGTKEVEFFECKAFKARAEVIGKYFKKGDGILVEGRIKTDQWADKETGQKRYRTTVVVDGIDFPPGKAAHDEAEDGAEEEAPQPKKPASKPQAKKPAQAKKTADDSSEEFSDDVPW